MSSELRLFNQHKLKLAENYGPFDQDGFVKEKKPTLPLDNEQFYHFSFNNRITADWDRQIFAGLLKAELINDTNHNKIIYYLNNTLDLLLHDADLAGNSREKEELQKLRNPPLPEKLQPWDKFQKDCKQLGTAIFHVSRLIDWLSFINLYRLISVFARLSWSSTWFWAASAKILDDQHRFWGITINSAILQAPTGIFNVLSVGLFMLRLSLHCAMIIKHACYPSDAEKKLHAPGTVAIREFYLRMKHILNDGVWAPINLITNYAPYFGISNALANQLVVGAVVFDLSWLCIQWICKEYEINDKRQELEELLQACPNDWIVKKSIEMLEDLRLWTRAQFLFQIAGCLLIISSYVATLVFTGGLVAPIGFFLCVLGFAMYGSCDEFATFVQTSAGKLKLNGITPAETGATFATTLLKTGLVPFLLIGAFTVSTPAAVVLTLLYILWEHYVPKECSAAAQPPTDNNSYTGQKYNTNPGSQDTYSDDIFLPPAIGTAIILPMPRYT